MDWVSLAGVALSSSTIGSVVTAFAHRKKNNVDLAAQSVQTALALEQVAHTRYTSAQEALEAAQQALDVARSQLRSYEDYVDLLHSLLDRAGIKYPSRQSVLG